MPLYFPKFHSLVSKAKESLQRGLGKQKLASGIAIGLVGGIFPVLGTTTVLCLALTFLFRTNHAIVQLVNWLVYPLQIIFYIPLIKLGTGIFSGPDFELNISQIKEAFQSGFFDGLGIIGTAHLYGILAWAVVGIPLALILVLLINVFYEQVRKVVLQMR